MLGCQSVTHPAPVFPIGPGPNSLGSHNTVDNDLFSPLPIELSPASCRSFFTTTITSAGLDVILPSLLYAFCSNRLFNGNIWVIETRKRLFK